MEEPQVKKVRPKKTDWNWTGIAFLPIGVTFIILGVQGNTGFLAVGIIFLIAAITMYSTEEPQGRAKEKIGSEGAEDPAGSSPRDRE